MTIYSKDSPFLAKLVERRPLTQEGGGKQTYHFELDISGSGLSYMCGDSVGIYVQNDPAGVAALLRALRLQADEPVVLPHKGEPVSLERALSCYCSLAQPTPNFLRWMLLHLKDREEQAFIERLLLPENAEALKAYLAIREYIDLAEEFHSLTVSAQDYVSQLRRLMPRLYSIASSHLLYPHQVHLTVDRVSYMSNGRPRLGVASSYLADRAPLGEASVPVFVAPSHFRLPENIHQDIILIGPGTGVAPFRGFMQERVALGSKGRSWLFFGAQQRKTDYLYEDEWEAYIRQGQLTRLSLAFSRDQAEKVYVQHQMAQAAEELWAWIEGGASIYVCGDAKAMAKDVEAALLNIIQIQGHYSPEEAKAYLKALKQAARYQRDVY